MAVTAEVEGFPTADLESAGECPSQLVLSQPRPSEPAPPASQPHRACEAHPPTSLPFTLNHDMRNMCSQTVAEEQESPKHLSAATDEGRCGKVEEWTSAQMLNHSRFEVRESVYRPRCTVVAVRFSCLASVSRIGLQLAARPPDTSGTGSLMTP
ncbi:unnamed protein product [Pleuronectes platessa]|uniref:Uncharacterized protein n=1 Tax=Pleuronectes platessa TaxID=8262 RepID=A0A9N7VMZ1_PLEPL|nr:unnamed protein product [Pleuronectes platessa]